MYNKKRETRYNKVMDQMKFCEALMNHLTSDISDQQMKQEVDDYDNSDGITNATIYVSDARRIRREVLKLEKILEKSTIWSL